MPIGIQRINAKKSQPNDRIVFIKPLKCPDEAIAQDFLERIAAQCLPIMKEHHLSVMSLEEYEPNAEFVGRNFNAGEVIQLVLKARFTGHWLPFNYVQMVMMHELAHCKQMNHARAFWAVRNEYAEQMRGLWTKGYRGEGLWGRGALLSTGEWERNSVQDGEVFPEHLCGGTYRSRGRKRKVKQVLTYQEKKERLILKKFGVNGVSLGEDVTVKRQLEKGRTVFAKPRVAGSARGRELRAAAALARFEKTKKETETKEEKIKNEEDSDETASGSETDSCDEYEDGSAFGQTDAVDIDGKRLLDAKGRGMIKICEDENPEDHDAQYELLELQSFGSQSKPKNPTIKMEEPSGDSLSQLHPAKKPSISNDAVKTTNPPKPGQPSKKTSLEQQPLKRPPNRKTPQGGSLNQQLEQLQKTTATEVKPTKSNDPPARARSNRGVCSVCSFANTDGIPITCAMCGNVLDLDKVPGSWACKSQACAGSKYMNSGDAGVCSVCGERKKA